MGLETKDINKVKLLEIIEAMNIRGNEKVLMLHPGNPYNIDPNNNDPGCFACELCLAMNDLNVPNLLDHYEYGNEGDRFVSYITDGKYHNRRDFTVWANINPKIWGNNSGSLMFNSAQAFGKDKCNAYTTVNDIMDHLQTVLYNISLYEQDKIMDDIPLFIIHYTLYNK